MKHHHIARVSCLALALSACALTSAQADSLQNSSFSQGLQAWSSQGDVSVQNGALFGLNLGASPALVLGTATTWFDDDAPAAAGAYNVSGHDPVDLDPLVNLPASSLESGLGLPLGAFGTQAYEASVASQTFTVTAGDQISFTWRLLTQASTSDTPLPDTAWLLWSEAGSTTLQALGDVDSLNTAGALQQAGQGWLDSGLRTHQFTAGSNGTVTLGWALADVGSYGNTSLLSIQNVTHSPAVPEPESIALVLAGLVLMGRLSRRMHQV